MHGGTRAGPSAVAHGTRDAWLRALRGSLLIALVVAGAAAGVWALSTHLANDPLADTRAYYDAAQRLNAGQPLYPAGADTNVAEFYRYPPLLAIVFRPLALLPYEAAAGIWEVGLLAAFGLTLYRIGLRRRTFVAVALLGLPIAWALSIGQAQIVVTLLLTFVAPWSVALAANLKILPAIVALFWLGRRDWRSLATFVGWMAGLGLLQLVLEPAGTLAFLSFSSLEQVGRVNNLSPYALSPILWAVLVGAGVVAVLAAARGRWGWAAAVALSTVASPRLLSYMLSSLLACLPTSRPADVAAPARRVDGSGRWSEPLER